MNRARTMPRICFILTALLTLIGVFVRTVCMLTQFEADIGYFTEGFLPTLSRALYMVAALCAVVAACLIPKGTLPQKLMTPHRLPAALLTGTALALFSPATFVLCYPTGTMVTVLAVLGLLGSTYFFISANRQGQYADRLAALGLLPLLWSIAGIAETYSDQTTTMNSPVKLALQMGFVGLMLILIAELRFRLHKTPAPRCAVAFMSIGAFFCLNAAVPILAAAGSMRETLHILYAAVLLCGGLYGGYILFSYTCFPHDNEVVDEPTDDPSTSDGESAIPDTPPSN